MKVFVTGATGLIGSSTVRALVAAGHEVSGLTSRASNAAIIEKAGARAVVGDMRDAAVYRDVAHAADAVVHTAAAWPEKTRLSAADVDAFLGGDAAAVDALLSVLGPTCRAFVVTSGAYVYGDTGLSPIDESASTERHHLVMARKVETEAKLLALARAGKAPAIIVRPGLVYGDGGLWSKLYLAAMKQRKRAMIPGNGRNLVSFVHESDVGTAYRAIVERGEAGAIYNIADDHPAPAGDVARAQAIALGAPTPWSAPGWLVRLVAGPYSAPGPLANTVISNARLKKLGWSPRYPSYQEGVAAVAEGVRCARARTGAAAEPSASA